jgi:DNA-binding NtrC family response regulator
MSKRIFIIDDEKNIADTLAMILRRASHQVNVFYDAQSALVELAVCCPDLIITDVFMPEMNGIEMAVLARRRHPACQILLFSGNAVTSDLLKDVREQGYDFELLAKPIHPTELLARIAR